jgi:hypothetical protein
MAFERALVRSKTRSFVSLLSDVRPILEKLTYMARVASVVKIEITTSTSMRENP